MKLKASKIASFFRSSDPNCPVTDYSLVKTMIKKDLPARYKSMIFMDNSGNIEVLNRVTSN